MFAVISSVICPTVLSQKLSKTDLWLLWDTIMKPASLILLLHSDPPADALLGRLCCPGEIFWFLSWGIGRAATLLKTLLQYYGKSLEALPGVAYPGFRDNRSTLNTKTGFKKKKYKICAYTNTASCSTWHQTTAVVNWARPVLSTVVNRVRCSDPSTVHALCCHEAGEMYC